MPLSSVLQAFKSRKPSPSAKKIRVGLIGAGRMGQLHARLIHENSGADFAGITDADPSRAEALARKWRTKTFLQSVDLIGQADGAFRR